MVDEAFLYFGIPYVIAFLSGFLAGKSWYDPNQKRKYGTKG